MEAGAPGLSPIAPPGRRFPRRRSALASPAMSEHRLRPLLAPTSIALVGASAREGSFGLATLRNLAHPGFAGRVHPVNPGYEEIEGRVCYPSLAAIPGGVEHAVLSVANAGIEQALTEAAEAGVAAATLFGSAYLEGDSGTPKLMERLRAIAREAGMAVCGANCMGFVNYESATRATWMPMPADGWFEPGHIALVSHSGTCFLTLQFIDPRHRHNLCVSAGQELTVTAADYMDYALQMASTRVIALFLETVRDPQAFRAVLDKAAARGVPVVAIKVGATERSAALARSHSGALAGDDAAYEALFDHYGVLRVETWDELAATCRLLAHDKQPGPGALAGIMDSGGARGMLIDLAWKAGVKLAEIGPQTEARLAALLEYGLEPVNPTDVWGTGRDWEKVYRGCMGALADDPASCAVVLFSDIGFPDRVGKGQIDVAEEVDRATAKPVYLCQHWSRAMQADQTARAAASPVPVFEGTQTFLTAFRLAGARRDRREDGPGDMPPAPPPATVRRWRARLEGAGPLDENAALDLLAAFGVATPARRLAADAGAAAEAARAVGFPVALKTAAAGILHKSDVDGVRLGLDGPESFAAAYDDLARRLGPRVLVAAMAPPGVELAAGLVRDAQFGPLVLVAAGGVLIETFADRRLLLPPVGVESARRAIDALACRPLLDAVRSRPAADLEALAWTLARFGRLAETLGDLIAEFDVNPLLAGPQGTVAVDALALPAAGRR